MSTVEREPSRRALAALIGFLARGPASGQLARRSAESGQVGLERSDGARRAVKPRTLAVALERGLISFDAPAERSGVTIRIFVLTPAGRAALRRWLSDPADAFQAQHRRLATRPDADHGRVTVNAEESPLAALARLRGRDGLPFLDPSQVEAGDRLRADFTRGHMMPSLGQRWEPVRLGRRSGASGGINDLNDAALAARLRVTAAMAAVGPELSGVLVDVCCFLKGLVEIERERQWPARSAKLMLRTALAALARHYAAPAKPLRPQPAPPPHAP